MLPVCVSCLQDNPSVEIYIPSLIIYHLKYITFLQYSSQWNLKHSCLLKGLNKEMWKHHVLNGTNGRAGGARQEPDYCLRHSFKLRVEAWCKALLNYFQIFNKNYANLVDYSYLGSVWFSKKNWEKKSNIPKKAMFLII